jgi:predicted nuclease with RNAse H fold
MKVFLGIDLAAKEKNPTGIFAINYKGEVLEEGIVFSNESIFKFVERNKPKVIAIDAPLSLPVFGNVRTEERILMKKGYKLFPFFDSMRLLAERGMMILEKYKNKFTIIEVCPAITAKILNIEREKNKLRRHVEDAKLAALNAKMFDEGKCVLVNGRFYMPKKD